MHLKIIVIVVVIIIGFSNGVFSLNLHSPKSEGSIIKLSGFENEKLVEEPKDLGKQQSNSTGKPGVANSRVQLRPDNSTAKNKSHPAPEPIDRRKQQRPTGKPMPTGKPTSNKNPIPSAKPVANGKPIADGKPRQSGKTRPTGKPKPTGKPNLQSPTEHPKVKNNETKLTGQSKKFKPNNNQPTVNSKPKPSSPTGAPKSLKPTSEPKSLKPTSEPKSLKPTGEPKSPSPNGDPRSTKPTGEPKSPSPNGDPRSRKPTGEPKSPNPNGDPRSTKPTDRPRILPTKGTNSSIL